MTELTREKLNKILEEHKHWINEDCKNWEKMRADLSDVALSDVALSDADLRDIKNVTYIPKGIHFFISRQEAIDY